MPRHGAFADQVRHRYARFGCLGRPLHRSWRRVVFPRIKATTDRRSPLPIILVSRWTPHISVRLHVSPLLRLERHLEPSLSITERAVAAGQHGPPLMEHAPSAPATLEPAAAPHTRVLDSVLHRLVRREAVDVGAWVRRANEDTPVARHRAEAPLMMPALRRQLNRREPDTRPRTQTERPASPPAPSRVPITRPTDRDVAELTERVLRSIDQRWRAHRERLGRS